MKYTIDIDGMEYMLDLDKTMKWISECPSNENRVDTEIHIIEPLDEDSDINIPVEDDMEEYPSTVAVPSTKEVTESKSNKNPQMSEIRWNLVFKLIDTLFSSGYNSDRDIACLLCNNRELTFAHRLAINTLMDMGILKICEEK